jgi:hypothetical protein
MDILEVVGNVSNVFGAIGGGFALLAWLRLRAFDRENDPVKIILALSGQEARIALPLEMRRRDLTRAELLGRLGMLPMREPGKRFSLSALASADFMRAVNAAREGASVVEIPCSQAELDQFQF